jgi:hypothetical protein
VIRPCARSFLHPNGDSWLIAPAHTVGFSFAPQIRRRLGKLREVSSCRFEPDQQVAAMPGSPLRSLLILEARVDFLEQILINLGLIGHVDPGPSDLSRLGAAPQELLRRHPGDPAASDRIRLMEAMRRPGGGPGPIIDPAATDRVRLMANLGVSVTVSELIERLINGIDPPPGDLARLTVTELEAALHTVNTELVRLRSAEGLLSQRLKDVKEGPGAAPKPSKG